RRRGWRWAAGRRSRPPARGAGRGGGARSPWGGSRFQVRCFQGQGGGRQWGGGPVVGGCPAEGRPRLLVAAVVHLLAPVAVEAELALPAVVAEAGTAEDQVVVAVHRGAVGADAIVAPRHPGVALALAGFPSEHGATGGADEHLHLVARRRESPGAGFQGAAARVRLPAGGHLDLAVAVAIGAALQGIAVVAHIGPLRGLAGQGDVGGAGVEQLDGLARHGVAGGGGAVDHRRLGLDENGGGHIPRVVIGGRGVPGVVVIPAVGNGHPHRRGGIPGVAAAGGGAVLGIVPAAGGGGR